MKHHKFSRKSEDNLEGVHPDLIKLIYLGLEFSPYDLGITCGPRSVAEHKHLVDSGKSWTMDSKHLYQSDGFAHAVDFVVYVNGKVSWDIQYYRPADQPRLAPAHGARRSRRGIGQQDCLCPASPRHETLLGGARAERPGRNLHQRQLSGLGCHSR